VPFRPGCHRRQTDLIIFLNAGRHDCVLYTSDRRRNTSSSTARRAIQRRSEVEAKRWTRSSTKPGLFGGLAHSGFRGEIFVVEYGGSHGFSEAAERHRVARESCFWKRSASTRSSCWRRESSHSRLESAGLTTTFLQGQRVTDEATVKVVDDVLSRNQPEMLPRSNRSGAGRAGSRGRKFIAAGNSTPRMRKEIPSISDLSAKFRR
jgi:hypothetical protein